MLEHGWEKPSKKACGHAGESDALRVSSLLPRTAQPFPRRVLPCRQLWCATHWLVRGRVPGPSIRCRSQAVQGAAASGFSRLLTSPCTLSASAEKCPPGRWPQQDLTAQEAGCHPGLEGASQTQRGQRLCCQNMAPVQWVWEQSLYSPQ